MRFFRGIAVPAGDAPAVIAGIRDHGLKAGDGRWLMKSLHPGPIKKLFSKPDLGLEDTRPTDEDGDDAVCACGDASSASYYAWRHNRSARNDTPVLIEFDAPASSVAVDGKDLLYTVFTQGDPDRSQTTMKKMFGEDVLDYLWAAWASSDVGQRLALCDLAVHDPKIVECHYSNALVIGGRHGTLFKSAFLIRLPILPENITRVWTPSALPELPQADVRLDSLLADR